ncbi:sigma-70 family RNA polymerase sigma factor [Microvirga solisilvae]|uniref:sigma-70 family RNA polymerase sigma factor n=1 Tax=Microvirga solisilvae TaxID=2919498 RepID=UPI001FAFFCE9|nr:sigma-70 family RNA polymerase sigma factor [Microvirga solisilvae]
MARAAPSAQGPDFDRLLLSVGTGRDKDAFSALFQHFAPRIKTYLMRSGCPGNVAEELAQEALLSVWRKAASFDPARAGAGVWIFTIARNLRIDQIRRDRNAATYEPDPSDEPDLPPPADSYLLASEREERVRTALKHLSEEQAKIVQMSFFHDKPHAEIARDLGIPLGTVKSRIRLAMDRLRNLLGDLL